MKERDGNDPVTEKKRVLLDEKKLASMLGIKRRFLARWRMSFGSRDIDYSFSGSRVVMTVDGLRSACKSLGVSISTPKAIMNAEAKDDGSVSVRVKLCPQNTKKLVCVRLDKNEAVVVEVRSNFDFRVDDEFDAVREGEDLVFRGSWPERGW